MKLCKSWFYSLKHHVFCNIFSLTCPSSQFQQSFAAKFHIKNEDLLEYLKFISNFFFQNPNCLYLSSHRIRFSLTQIIILGGLPKYRYLNISVRKFRNIICRVLFWRCKFFFFEGVCQGNIQGMCLTMFFSQVIVRHVKQIICQENTKSWNFEKINK